MGMGIGKCRENLLNNRKKYLKMDTKKEVKRPLFNENYRIYFSAIIAKALSVYSFIISALDFNFARSSSESFGEITWKTPFLLITVGKDKLTPLTPSMSSW